MTWARIFGSSAATHKISKGRVSDWMPVGEDLSYKDMVVVEHGLGKLSSYCLRDVLFRSEDMNIKSSVCQIQ